MRLLLVKICAVAAVNLVADGADAQAANYITEPARALRHDPSIKRLRAQQNANEERVNDVPTAFNKIMEEYRSTNSVLPDVVTSALKSKRFNDIFNELHTEGVSIDDVDKAMEGRETDVTAAIRDAYAKFKEMEFMRFINEFDLDNSPDIPHSAVEPVQPTLTQPVHLPLAQPVRPTLAESVHPVLAGSVHPTLADPVSARLKGKGPAEAIGGQLDPKVLIHPTDGLTLSKLDKEQADKILSEWPNWIEIVKSHNEKNPETPILVVDFLKQERKIEEKNLVNAVLSLGLPRKTQGNMNVERKTLSRPKTSIKLQIIDELTKYWLQHDTEPGDLLPTFGLVPTLSTGHDFARLVEWMKYARRWNKKREPSSYLPMTEIAFILNINNYTTEQLLKFLEHSDGKHGDMGNRMIKFLTKPKRSQPVSPNSPKKRKGIRKLKDAFRWWRLVNMLSQRKRPGASFLTDMLKR